MASSEEVLSRAILRTFDAIEVVASETNPHRRQERLNTLRQEVRGMLALMIESETIESPNDSARHDMP